MKKKTIISILIIILVFIGSCFSIVELFNNMNYGLDLQGGFEVLYEIESIDDKKLDSDMVYNTYKAILKRIDILGVSEPEITIEGENRIRVKLAGIKNADEARRVIASTASLTFRDYNDNLLMTSDVLGGSAKVTTDQNGRPAVSLSIKDVDTFYDQTSRISKMKPNNLIVIWLDYNEDVDSYSKEKEKCGSMSNSRCLSAASVDQGFASDVIIQGSFTKEEVKSLVELINSGALPTKLTELSSRTVEASFGENSLNKTLIAGIIGILLVIVLITSIYRFSGFIASLGLILYTLFTFLIFYLIGGVLTLPGIAAMLLGIGMAVDACVINFERIKDHLKIGKSLKTSIEIGDKLSFSSIIDSNLTTMIVAIILFIFGESSIKGFATMLIISIIITILIMVFLTRWIVKYFAKIGFFDNKLGLFIGLNKNKIVKSKEIIIPHQNLDFMKSKNKFFIITLSIIVIGCILSFTRGINLGVDFTGGTSITVNKNDNVTIEKLKKDLKEYKIRKESNNDKEITIIIEEILDNEDIAKLSNEINDKYEVTSDIYVVSKLVKQELTKNALYSLLIASIGIVIYVSFRFKFNYAISGLIALLHDVLIVILMFAIFKIEINSLFIAAILTIIGYSINDTIVTFDMIRQTYKDKYKNDIKDISKVDELVNTSVRLTLGRSIITTLTTILPVICLIIMGAKEIVNFNIALLIGFIAGVYSSIFISNQIWAILEKRSIKNPKEDDEDDDDELNEYTIRGVNS